MNGNDDDDPIVVSNPWPASAQIDQWRDAVSSSQRITDTAGNERPVTLPREDDLRPICATCGNTGIVDEKSCPECST